MTKKNNIKKEVDFEKNKISDPVSSKFRSICEVHREIYDEVIELPDEEKREKIIDLLQEAYIMGKKIARKLFEYKGGDKEAFLKEMNYEHNLDKARDKARRRQRSNNK